MKFIVNISAICLSCVPVLGYSQAFEYQSYNDILSSKTTWKDLQRKNVIKQDIDYSCGSASLATILTYFYNQPTTTISSSLARLAS